jgi:hypothetical protein
MVILEPAQAPWEYFDMIGGTKHRAASSPFMLGRLRERISQNLFSDWLS